MKTKVRKLAFDYVTLNEIINLEKEHTINSKSRGFPEELGLSFDLGNNKIKLPEVLCNLICIV